MHRGRLAQLFAAAFLIWPFLAHADKLPSLLRYRGEEMPVASAGPLTARWRVVVNPKALIKRSFSLQLPNGQAFPIQRRSLQSRERHLKTLSARLLKNGTAVGDMSLTYRYRKALYGVIQAPADSRMYVLRQDGRRQVLEAMSSPAFKPCGVSEKSGHPLLEHGVQPPPTGNMTPADPVVAKVLVVYTTATRDAAGGTDQILAQVNTAVSLANTAYSNSVIPHSLQLVHAQELTQPESGDMSNDLDNLSNSGDGIWDDVHTLRTQYGADFVSVLVESGSYCGIAWLSTGGAEYLFSVVLRTCISNHTFAHELGHNLGAGHDSGNGSGVFPYSYGWRFTGNDGFTYRTVMAYAPGTRINYFSNPNVNYQGQPTGVQATAYNAQTLNTIFPTAAAAVNDVGGLPTATPLPGSTATATPTPTPSDAAVPGIPGVSPTATPTPAPTSRVTLRRQQFKGHPKLFAEGTDTVTNLPLIGIKVSILRSEQINGTFKRLASRTLNSAGQASYTPKLPGYYRARLPGKVLSKKVKVKM